MEIKVGDKVRVREDAPEMYFFGCNHDDSVCKVIFIDRDDAVITQPKNGSFPIPCKYLVKVEEEKKGAKPKFKIGDRVRIISLHGRPIPDGDVDVIAHINIGNEKQMYFLENHYGCAYGFSESDLEPYVEPTEEKKDNTITIPVKVDLDDTFWDAYAADLAKEVALKVANKYNDPKEAAEYAVSVAKSVVEGLKRK